MKNIRLKGAINVRDLGGLPVAGGCVRPHRLLRAAMLNELTEEDVRILADRYEVRLCLDLRTEQEIIDRPNAPLGSIEYRKLPLLSEENAGITREKGTTARFSGKGSLSGKELRSYIPSLDEVYPCFVRDAYSRSQLAEAIRAILAQPEGAVLYHCSGGKDRTGVLSALLLELLGADRKTIYRDYLFTNRAHWSSAVKYYLLVLIFKHDRIAAARLRDIFLARRRYLDSVYQAIEKDYGSVRAYLTEGLGLTEEEIEAAGKLRM